MNKKKWSQQTCAIRAGQIRTDQMEHAEAIFPTSSYVFDTAEQAMSLFKEELPGNVYSRFTNPTVQMFERRLAAMEGAERCVATASGMAAIQAIAFSLLKAGDRVLVGVGLFGSTTGLFKKYLPRFGVNVEFVDLADIESWRQALQQPAKLVWIETPTNPVIQLVDIAELAKLSKKAGALLGVDNTFCSPVLQQPIALGADLVMHAATKYIDGQGRCIGGAVLGSEEIVGGEVYQFLKTTGACMSPFNAWVFIKGLETLPLRMRMHCENAMEVAQWLEAHPKVHKVNYPGLRSHPQHEIAVSQQSGFGGVVSFEIVGQRTEAWSVIDKLELITRTGNLGDTKSMMTHPATTTHSRLSPEEQAQAGINESLLRFSAGLESVDDIIADLQQALA